MVDSVKVTPASRKIEFFNPTTAAAKSTISLDTSGNLTIVADGTIDIGDTSADIYVGDGSSNVDIVYTADGEIRTEGSGVELSLVSAETMSAKVPLLHISDTGTTHKTLLKLDNGLDTDGGRGVGMDFRVRFTSSNIHTSQIYFDFYGDKWTDSIGMNYVSGRSGTFSHHHFRDQAGATQLMIADDGEVGIGSSFTHAAQPDAKLHLKGSGGGEKILIEDTGTNSNPALEIKNDAVHWKLQARGGDSDNFRIVEDSTTHAVIDTSGRFGIGVAAPTDSLCVRGGIKIGEFNDADGTGYAGSAAPNSANLGTGATDPQIRVSGRSTGNPGIIQMAHFDANNFLGGTTEFVLGRLQYAMNENSNNVTTVAEIRGISSRPNDPGHFDGALTFLTSQGDGSGANLTEKMMLTADGNLGIGQFPFTRNGATTVNGPDTMLHLASGTGDVTLKIEADIENDTESHNPMIWLAQDGSLVNFKIGIQETGNHAYLRWEASTDKDLIFYNDSNERMRLTGDGNLGIGDSTPTYRLDVNGTGRFTGDLTGDSRIRGGYGTGEVEFNRSDGLFTQYEFATGTLGKPTYSAATQNLTAVTTQGNCVRVSGSGTNASYQIAAAGKQALFNVVLSGDGSVLDTFQSFDCTVYVGDAAHNLVHRKTIKCLYDGANTTLYYSYVDEMENFTNDMFDVYVEHLSGDSSIAGIATDNIQVARVGITVGAVNTLTPNKLTANQLDWSWEFTGLKDEAHVG